MPNHNQINIDGDGNITLQNINGSTISINKNDDANAILEKLTQLHNAQLDALQQIMALQTEKFSDLLNKSLKGIVTQKNIVLGSISHVGGNVHVGDNITYIIQPKATIPQELTINLPKVEDLARIIGRTKDLAEIRQLLQDNQKVVVVNGLGGIGKTTLAQAYLTQYSRDYAHILWLTQSEGDNFKLDLITAQGLTHNLGIATQGKDTQMLFNEIIAQLKNIEDAPNLFVIDNANTTLQGYFNYLPKPPNWHVLATSREKIERFFVKDLDFLSEDEAVLLFKQHCTRISDETAIRSILKAIDCHTLTIEILAKTAQRYDTPLSTLQQAIEKDLKAEVYIPHNGNKIERVGSYLLSIFDLAPLSNEEQRLLQHFAALPTEYIPYELLKKLIPENEEGISATLQDLCDKGWLLHKSAPESYKMHLIIQEVVKRKLPPTVNELSGLMSNVTDLLYIDETKDNPVDKFPFIPYGEAILALFPEAIEAEIGSLQNVFGLVLQYLGDYKGAKELLEKAVHSAEKNFGENHPSTARSYSNLALVLQDLGDYNRAKELLEKAVQSDEKNFGENHPSTARSYSNLATVLKDIGDYNRAKELLEKAVHSAEKNFGENHPSTAICYANLATVLKDLGDYKGAKELLEKAVQSDEKNFGENHPSTARSYSNLASILQNLGDYNRAKELLEKAVQSDEKNFGKNHPSTAISYSNLATVLQDLGDYKEAFILMNKAFQVMTSHFEENHPNRKIVSGNLNNIIEDMLKNGWTMERIEELKNK